jgi:hypothetical protein
MELEGQLSRIFTRIGEEWLQSGEHFIPLKTGGQINLKMESYPLINLSNGHKIIIDLYGDLPEKMVKLIQSNWDFYRVVKLGPDVDLRAALNRILPLCEYKSLYRTGVPLDLRGDIGLQLKADWIIGKVSPGDEKKRKWYMIHLLQDEAASIPNSIIKYLHDLGIETVVFPFADTPKGNSDFAEIKPLELDDRTALIAEILKANGLSVSRDVEIPLYQKQKKDFNLIIKADFLFSHNNRDCVIDLHGLDENAIALLTEHRFKVFSLGPVRDGDQIAAKILGFLNRSYDHRPHDFTAFGNRNNLIQLTISGVTFRGDHDQDILITSHNLPLEVVDFLATKGYRVLIMKKEA